MYESIVITRHGKIAEVALNRPRSYNAFDLEADDQGRIRES
jgi:enoyl-CoA hydratase/carnithine racemase